MSKHLKSLRELCKDIGIRDIKNSKEEKLLRQADRLKASLVKINILIQKNHEKIGELKMLIKLAEGEEGYGI